MDTLKSTIERQIFELISNGFIQECRELDASIKAKGGGKVHRLEEKALPMHFSGDLYADIVFVELNPGVGNLVPTISGNELVMAGSADLQPRASSTPSFFKSNSVLLVL